MAGTYRPARAEAEFEQLLQRADEAFFRLLKRRRPQRRQAAPADPHGAAAARARREALQLYERAKTGAFTRQSDANKRRLLDRFVRLLRESGASPQRINSMKGNFDEWLRTPPGARTTGRAQGDYRGGGPLLPGEERRGHTRIDYDQSRRTPGGGVTREVVNLKSDEIHLLSPAEAVARARRYTNDAVSQVQRNLPAGSTIVIRYAHRPAPPIQAAMVREHFRPGSPIRRVVFNTTGYHNPQIP